MLRYLPAFVLAASLSLPALAEDGKEEKALDAYGTAVKNMNATEGYHLDSKIDVDMGGSTMPGGTVEGTIRNPGFGHFKVDIAGNSLDLFKEGDNIAYLNPQTGKWEGQTGNQTLDFFVKIFNLGTLLQQLRDMSDEAKFGKEDSLGKRECRVVELVVPKKALEKLMEGSGKGSLGVSPENAKMKVKAWIDKKENLPRKILITIDVEMKGLPGAGDEGEDWDEWEEDEEPRKEEGQEKEEEEETEEEVPPMQITITVDASIKKYGEDLKVEVPEEARKLLDEKPDAQSEPRKDEKKKE